MSSALETNYGSKRSAYLVLLFLTLLLRSAHADYATGQRLRDAGDTLGAFVAWEESANAGDAKSQAALGLLYEQGVGVPQNYLQAYVWYALAAARGEAAALAARNALAKQMTPEQIAGAQALAAQWKPAAAPASPAAPPPFTATTPTASGPGALVAAAEQGDLAAVKQLLASGVSANATDATGVTPLLMGALSGHAEVVAALLAAGAKGDTANTQSGGTALMAAALNGHVAVVEKLLAAKVNVAAKNKGGTTALDIARVKGQSAVVKLLEPKTTGAPDFLVSEAQKQFNRIGYPVGTPDGKAGPRTLAAVRAFQQQKGLPADGQVNQSLVSLLQAEPAAEAAFSAPAVTAAPRTPGATFSDPLKSGGQGPEMVVIPPGSFSMGSPSSETGRTDDEGPQHIVTLKKPFALGRYEVTVRDFLKFVAATNHRTDAENNAGGNSGCFSMQAQEWKWEYIAGRQWQDPGFPQSEHHPVTCVSWNDATAYVAWLSRETGRRYRLPSEAEWEYAARAGTTQARFWGSNDGDACQFANVADTSRRPSSSAEFGEKFDCSDGAFYPNAVGSYRANPFGVYDVIGNVWEWTEDCWNTSYHGAPQDGTAWSRGDCGKRVARGGGWLTQPAFVRAAYRVRDGRAYRGAFYGFRLATDL